MSIETRQDLEGLHEIGRIVRRILEETRELVRPGITTADLDSFAAEVLLAEEARSAPKLIYDYPGTTCISINDEAVHGIPGNRVVREGDLVKIDVAAEKNGYIADAAITVAVPPMSEQYRMLLGCAELAFYKAMQIIRAGVRVSEIGRVVEQTVQRQGFSVIRELSGHGVGRLIHEAPSVLNYYDPSNTAVLTEGLVITVEPIICDGSGRIIEDKDGWTLRTVDGGYSAHYEHTLIVTDSEPILLTAAA